MNIFYNSVRARVRAGWRLTLQGVVFLIGSVLAALLLDLPNLPLVSKALFLVFVLLTCWAAARFLDHRPFSDFGFHLSREWWRDLAFGLALGAVLMLGIFLVERAAGWITVTRVLVDRARAGLLANLVIGGAIGYVFVGIYEELFSRVTRCATWRRDSGGSSSALVRHCCWLISSHRCSLVSCTKANANATALTTPVLALSGLFLGLGYLLTGELAIPIGLHITWNFFQGNVFGFPVSGAGHGGSLLGITQGGPVLWTGGSWGPEGGLIGLLALIAGSLLIIVWVRKTRGAVLLEDRLAVYERSTAPGNQAETTMPATKDISNIVRS